MKALVFLGGGRITSAIVAGLKLARYKAPIIVHDRHPEKLRELQRTSNVDVEPDLPRAVKRAHILLIAVRPDSVEPLLEQIGEVKNPTLGVSLAAGIPLAKLRGRLGTQVRWARAMPSPVSRVGRGLTALTFDRGIPWPAQREVSTLFAQVGQVIEIPEKQFDGFTVTYSSSHGYHALATLAKAAAGTGLDRKTALLAAAHALADGIQAWRESGMSLENLLQEAATPGGIAATVMDIMDADGYAKTVERALKAGLRRSQQNAKR